MAIRTTPEIIDRVNEQIPAVRRFLRQHRRASRTRGTQDSVQALHICHHCVRIVLRETQGPCWHRRICYPVVHNLLDVLGIEVAYSETRSCTTFSSLVAMTESIARLRKHFFAVLHLVLRRLLRPGESGREQDQNYSQDVE